MTPRSTEQHPSKESMNPIITAALLMCSNGNPTIADKIAIEATKQDMNVAVALTIGIMESGLGRKSSDNPMGVRGCYPKAKKKYKRTTNDCIRIGVTSIRNRLSAAQGVAMTSAVRKTCGDSGNVKMCRALIVYNGADKGRKFVYAKRAMGIIRQIYRITGSKVPNT
jgi:hypothetical protein